jgi:4-aminobutyrate aminotransferase
LEEGLTANAAKVGEFLSTGLRQLQEKHRLIGQVRGPGLMIGVDLVLDRRTKEPAASLRDQLVERCFRKGLLLLGCGESTVRLCPPLVIEEPEAKVALTILDAALSELEAELPAWSAPPLAVLQPEECAGAGI